MTFGLGFASMLYLLNFESHFPYHEAMWIALTDYKMLYLNLIVLSQLTAIMLFQVLNFRAYKLHSPLTIKLTCFDTLSTPTFFLA